MLDTPKDEKVVRLHGEKISVAQGAEDHPLTHALKRVGPILPAPETPPTDPFADRRPNWLAIGVLTTLSILGFSIAFFTSPTTDEGVRLGAAMAMIFGIITLGGALLYRYGREFWMARNRR